jgi:glycosyltransferase involved in cell wall biosynthesis
MQHKPDMSAEQPPAITLAITELDRGGAEKALVRLAVGLKNRGWRVNVISLRDAGVMASELTAAGIDVSALGCGGLPDIRCLWRLNRQLQSQRPDVLLTFLNQANLHGRIAGWWANVPAVACGIRVADRRRIVTWPERMTKGLVSHYIACGDSVANVHAQHCGIPRSQISVILNGVDAPEVAGTSPISRDGLKISDQTCLLLFVGRLTKQKGLDDLLHAITRSHASAGRELHLVVVGDGPDRQKLERTADELGIAGRCVFVGQVEDPRPYYEIADALVVPSRWEGTPNVLLEAMASGTPTIASAVDGVKDIADRYPGVQLFEPHNIDDLVHRLEAYDADPEEAQLLSRKAQVLVQKELTWESMVDNYDELLNSLLETALSDAN